MNAGTQISLWDPAFNSFGYTLNSGIVRSYNYTSLSPSWLSFFLSTLFLSCYYKWNCFCDFSFQIVTNLCKLSLYPATLLNSFISSNSFFCVKSIGFSTYKIMSSTSRDNFTSFSIWIPSFSCLIALARTQYWVEWKWWQWAFLSCFWY